MFVRTTHEILINFEFGRFSWHLWKFHPWIFHKFVKNSRVKFSQMPWKSSKFKIYENFMCCSYKQYGILVNSMGIILIPMKSLQMWKFHGICGNFMAFVKNSREFFTNAMKFPQMPWNFHICKDFIGINMIPIEFTKIPYCL